MTLDDLIEKLDALRRRAPGNGDLPVVLGLTGLTMPDEVLLEGDERRPYARICSVNDDRLEPTAFGRSS